MATAARRARGPRAACVVTLGMRRCLPLCCGEPRSSTAPWSRAPASRLVCRHRAHCCRATRGCGTGRKERSPDAAGPLTVRMCRHAPPQGGWSG